MYTTIFIGGINRSGGSLLARLFDGHPQVVSYPLEIGFPHDSRYYKKFESYTGNYLVVPSYDGSNNQDVFDLVEIPKERPSVSLKWGRERSDAVGVRKNYVEKVFYGTIKTDFDYDQFIRLFHEYRKGAKNIAALYDARHRAYFESWDKGKYCSKAQFVVMHSSGGLYLSNIDTFFNEFPRSVFIHPVRDVMGYIASEKTRLARRYFGSRRFSYPRFPNAFVKIFQNYDLEAQIRAWMVSLTRAVILQEKYGVPNNRFIVYSNETLLNRTEDTMKVFCQKIGLPFDPILVEPTIAAEPWQGNSHQGPSQGVNKELAGYYHKVLTKGEIEYIQKATAPIREYLTQNQNIPLDLTKIPQPALWDYDYQKRYFNDPEKIVLYSALMNTGRRRDMIKPVQWVAILAYLYSKFIYLMHLPRLLKLRFFPGLGKQNYT